MTIEQATMVRRVRDILGEDIRWQTLATAANSADTTIAVTDGTDWNEGSIIEWQDDGDQAYVQSVAANVATCIRGINGTTAAPHAATAATKDPTYPFIKVSDAIDATIQTVWPWAWKTKEASITPSPSTIYYNLGDDVIDLVRAWQEDASTIPIVQYFGQRGSGKPVAVAKNANSFSVGSFDYMVYFPNGIYHQTNSIYVQYRALITDAVASLNYTDISEDGLSEAICWGAAARLMKSQAAVRVRNDSRQWNSSVDIENINQVSDFYAMEFRRLLNDYHDSLLRTNPPMRTWTR